MPSPPHTTGVPPTFFPRSSTMPFNSSGAPFALCCANAVKKLAVSADHRPPTSPARTDEPGPPASSGYVRSFRLLGTTSAVPGLVADPALAVPSPCNALTSVASIASWAPPTRDNLLRRLLIVCHRRLAPVTNPHHGPSRWSRPLLRPLDRCVPQQPPPSKPEHMRQHTQTDDGQGSLGDGHIRQTRALRGNGNLRRRRSSVRKISESIRVA